MDRVFGIMFWAIALFGVTAAHGQSVGEFRDALSEPDPVSRAVVRIVEHGPASDVVFNYDEAGRPRSVQGYRIRIFFDNSQAAGKNSAAVQTAFREQFPSIPTYRAYESPSWIVTVGNCTTIEEAFILQNRVKNSFKTAFLWRGEIPLGEFLREGDELPETPADETQIL